MLSSHGHREDVEEKERDATPKKWTLHTDDFIKEMI